MEMIARGICKKSDVVSVSCIRALNGWLAKIKKLSVKRNSIQNPASYYRRKGFYGGNVQVIVFHEKNDIILQYSALLSGT